MTVPNLFTPLSIRNTVVRNRAWASPMCQYSANSDGIPTDWHLVNLGAFARGGAGLVFAEATAVSPVGRISPWDLGLWNDEQLAAFSRITAFIHSQGAAAGIQLAHAGRKASTFRPWDHNHTTIPVTSGGWQTVAPSAIAFGDFDEPHELSVSEIATVVADFRSAARRAVHAGFDVLEIHAAHGYLIHQFLSPLSNRRADEYGGDLAARARLLLQVIEAVREEVGQAIPLLVRFSASDWTEGGLIAADVATVANWAHTAGADFFDISSGGIVAAAQIPIGPGYQVPLASEVRSEASVSVSAVGLITEATQANQIIEQGRADAVMLGRALLRDPHWVLTAAHELGVDLNYWPDPYLRAQLATV